MFGLFDMSQQLIFELILLHLIQSQVPQRLFVLKTFRIILITHNFLRPHTSTNTHNLLFPLPTSPVLEDLFSCKKDTNFIYKRLSLPFDRLLDFINHLNIKNTIKNYYIFMPNPTFTVSYSCYSLIIVRQIQSNTNMSHKYESYKNYITCLGNICGCCCCSYTKVGTSSLGFIEEFGKFKDTLQPGLHYYNPLTQNIKTVDLKTKVVDMRNQIVYTKDNISVDIDTTLFYRIIDAYKATYIVKDILRSITEMTYVTMRTVCGQYVLQDLLTKRVQINDKIAQYVEKMCGNWGVHVEQITLKDMRLSGLLSYNLSIVSKTKRLVQSQIISASADLQCAKLYRQASDILDIKAAVQIRFLQTLENMNSMPSKKLTIIPLKHEYQVQK